MELISRPDFVMSARGRYVEADRAIWGAETIGMVSKFPDVTSQAHSSGKFKGISVKPSVEVDEPIQSPSVHERIQMYNCSEQFSQLFFVGRKKKSLREHHSTSRFII
jgi:hypothetical protein